MCTRLVSEQSSSSYESSMTTFEETVITTTYFTSTESFVNEVSMDTTSTVVSSQIDQTGETYLEQFQGLSMDGPVMITGQPINDSLTQSTGSCYRGGTFPVADPTMYLECSPSPALVLKGVIRKCPPHYVFSLRIGHCAHGAASDILRSDLGYRVGLSATSQNIIEGYRALLDFKDFVGGTFQCERPGFSPLENEDRVYLHCQNAGLPGKVEK